MAMKERTESHIIQNRRANIFLFRPHTQLVSNQYLIIRKSSAYKYLLYHYCYYHYHNCYRHRDCYSNYYYYYIFLPAGRAQTMDLKYSRLVDGDVAWDKVG